MDVCKEQYTCSKVEKEMRHYNNTAFIYCALQHSSCWVSKPVSNDYPFFSTRCLQSPHTSHSPIHIPCAFYKFYKHFFCREKIWFCWTQFPVSPLKHLLETAFKRQKSSMPATPFPWVSLWEYRFKGNSTLVKLQQQCCESVL